MGVRASGSMKPCSTLYKMARVFITVASTTILILALNLHMAISAGSSCRQPRPISTRLVANGDQGTCPSAEKVQSTKLQIKTEIRGKLSEIIPPGCPAEDGWQCVKFLDMKDPTHSCPEPWVEINDELRVCGRRESIPVGCSSIYTPGGVSYSEVCGMILGYQFGSTDAFRHSITNHDTINDPYVDGISLTHGEAPSRHHIWTFASGFNEVSNSNSVCPCAKITTPESLPSFLENKYFCETGAVKQVKNTIHSDDTLWDGKMCGPTSNCCAFNSPPWFTVTLPSRTTDRIEVRICTHEYFDVRTEDVLVEVIELYVR